jgi:aspartyl-tRNA(Asn)/glutamyl-tRNA(Gln) amidotransferase subunit C
MSLNQENIARLANLACLHLSDAEQTAALSQINNIIGLIDTLRQQDTAGIEPLAHPLAAIAPVVLRFREDVVTAFDHRQANQSNAPAIEQGLFLVPKVLD